ncbi:MAG: DarT ssDNA thymidine ADP-ribosyltransferase family protein, partial [Chloroflexota bacterium]
MKPKSIVKSLYYITHIWNLPSIMQHGILSHHRVKEMDVPYTPIYDREIVNLRQHKATPHQESLWSYANVYFQTRYIMGFRG